MSHPRSTTSINMLLRGGQTGKGQPSLTLIRMFRFNSHLVGHPVLQRGPLRAYLNEIEDVSPSSEIPTRYIELCQLQLQSNRNYSYFAILRSNCDYQLLILRNWYRIDLCRFHLKSNHNYSYPTILRSNHDYQLRIWRIGTALERVYFHATA